MGIQYNLTLAPPPAALPSSPAFLTAVSVDKRSLVDQNGQPFVMVADSAWALPYNVSTADMATYLSTRAAQGFNTALVALVGDAYISSNSAFAQTYDGVNIFTGTVGGKPDLSTPNPVYWARVDTLVSLARTYGITLVLTPADEAPPADCMAMLVANGHTACVNYGNFLANRYKNAPNVVWMHGNDYTDTSYDTYVAGIMSGIQAVWPTSLHTLEYDNFGSSYSLEAGGVWPTSIQLDQCYPTASDQVFNIEWTAYAASPVMPTFMGEWNYDGGAYSAYQLRQTYYWTTTAGSLGGYFYGNYNVFPFGTGWQSNLSTTAVTQFGYWASMVQGLAWNKLIPDTGNTFLTGGISSGFGTSTAALAADGSLGVVYCPSSNPVIAMSKMRGPMLARWYDPTAGTYATIGSFANTGSHTFTLPSAHGDGNNDYVLVLTA